MTVMHNLELGHEVVVADPNLPPMYATRRRRVKTDRRAAQPDGSGACDLPGARRRRRARGYGSARGDSAVPPKPRHGYSNITGIPRDGPMVTARSTGRSR
jgi:hypothetical protein